MTKNMKQIRDNAAPIIEYEMGNQKQKKMAKMMVKLSEIKDALDDL